jgi:hypothetical protein
MRHRTEHKEEVREDGAEIRQPRNIVQLRGLFGKCHAGKDELNNISKGCVDQSTNDVTTSQREILCHIAEDECERDNADEVLRCSGASINRMPILYLSRW